MDMLKNDLGNKQFTRLAETAALPYLEEGHFVHGFVHGKVLHDPVYREILSMNILPDSGKVIDLGCGRGNLLALLTTKHQLNAEVNESLIFQGFELRENDARIARNALGIGADIIHADIRSSGLPDCQIVFLIDVLMYLYKDEQKALLQKIFRVLKPNGVLIIREADADAGFTFRLTKMVERLCALSRGHWRQRYGYRSQKEWKSLLEELGFVVESLPMSQGTPYANILFIARLS
jgi:SAM-dependent methyltransferase